MKQKILLMFLLSGMFYTTVKANESEPNDTRNTANTLALNGSNSGVIGTATDVDWYKLVTNSDGKINLTLTVSNSTYCYFAIYDNDGTTLFHQDYTSTAFSYSVDGLAAGTYYVKIFPYNTGQMPAYTISNTLTVATPANDAEPDSTRAQAIVLPLNGSKTGHINYYYNHHNDSLDMYKVTTTGDGALNLALSVANNNYVYFALYDNDAKTVLHSDYTSTNFNYTVDGLAAGTYYIKIYPYSSGYFAPYTISNTLTVPALANDAEPDSTRAQAIVLPLNGSKTGHINYYYNHHNDSLDMYQVTTTGDGALNLALSVANNNYVYFALYDNDATTLLHSDYTSTNFNYTVDGLAAGTYYIKIYPYSSGYFASYTISNTLIVPAQANDAEPDSTRAQAIVLPLNSSKTGHINYYYNNHKDSLDMYKVTTTKDGALNLALSVANNNYVFFALYDNDAKTLLHSDYTSTNFNYTVDGLAAGTYYIKIYPYGSGYFAPYTLKDTLYTYNANDVEPNKYAKQARTLNSDLANNGHVGFYYNNAKDTADWFKINYTGNNGNMSVTLNVLPHATGGTNYIYMQVYKDTAAAPIYSDYTSGNITANFTGLSEGYYYVYIFQYNNTQFAAYTVTPTFTQADIAKLKVTSRDTLSNCSDTSTMVVRPSGSHAPYTVQLYRFGTPYGDPVTVGTGKTATFSGLPEGSYFARAYGDGATGAAFGKTYTIAFEPVPTGLNTTTIRATQATLNWDTLPCVKYFVIQYEVHGSGNWLVKKPSGNVDSYILHNLTAGTTYDWRIASADSANNIVAQSVYSDSITFTTTGGGLVADNNGADDLNAGKNIGVITIAPNPASSYFIIHYNNLSKGNVIATLYDLNGKPVWTSGTTNVNALNGKQVIVSPFGSGFYYLKITDDKGAVIGTAKVSIAK
jgi:chitinase